MGIVVKIAKMLNVGKTHRGRDLFGGGTSKGRPHRIAIYYMKRHRHGGHVDHDHHGPDDNCWTY